MAISPTKPFRMAPLQQLTVKPIENSAERTTLDERLKRSEGPVRAARLHATAVRQPQA